MAGRLAKGARITGTQRGVLAGDFATRYRGGESIRAIAEESGRSYGFVHGVLVEAGAELRGRGGATRGPRRTPSATPAKKTAAKKVAVVVAEPKAKPGKKSEPRKVATGKPVGKKKDAKKDKAKGKGKKAGARKD